MEARLLPSHGDWDMGAVSSSVIPFEGKGPMSFRKTFLRGTRFTPQRGREIICNLKFSTINVVRKGV